MYWKNVAAPSGMTVSYLINLHAPSLKTRSTDQNPDAFGIELRQRHEIIMHMNNIALISLEKFKIGSARSMKRCKDEVDFRVGETSNRGNKSAIDLDAISWCRGNRDGFLLTQGASKVMTAFGTAQQ